MYKASIPPYFKLLTMFLIKNENTSKCSFSSVTLLQIISLFRCKYNITQNYMNLNTFYLISPMQLFLQVTLRARLFYLYYFGLIILGQ